MSVPTESYDAILTKGLKSQLATTPVENGKLRFVTDTAELFLDDNNVRTEITDIIDSYTEAEIAQILAPLPKVYLTTDTHKMYVNVSGTWYDISAINLTAVPSTDNNDQVIWFSQSSANEPRYDADLKYNRSTKTLSVLKAAIGSVQIYTTTDQVSGDVTVDFV